MVRQCLPVRGDRIDLFERHTGLCRHGHRRCREALPQRDVEHRELAQRLAWLRAPRGKLVDPLLQRRLEGLLQMGEQLERPP